MWALNTNETTADSATDMAFAPMQLPKASSQQTLGQPMQTLRQPMQTAPTPAFRQPVQAQAYESPLAGLLKPSDIPGKNPSEDIDIVTPVTKREMMMAAALGAGAMMTGSASAEEEVSETLRKKLCASNPTSQACTKNSFKPKKGE